MKWHIVGPIAAAMSAIFMQPGSALAQQIVAPESNVDGDPLIWQLLGLPPGAETEVTLKRSFDGRAYWSSAIYRAQEDGSVDPCRDTPLSGSYAGVDCAGLVWSLLPLNEGAGPLSGLSLAAETPGGVMAQADIALQKPAVRTERVDAFPGARLFLPNAVSVPPVVILLGGSEGGDWFGNTIGPRLAAQGFAALSLPYYSSAWGGPTIAGLPTAFRDIPIDRLATVRDWLVGRRDLDGNKIALYGASKGGEFALAAATRFDWIDAVVAIVPSDVIWEGWGDGAPAGTSSSFSWRGGSLPFVPYEGMDDVLAGFAQGRGGSFLEPHVEGRRRNPQAAAAARIPVETIAAPLFLAGGDRDGTWPSGQMVRTIAERRAESGLVTEAHTFRDAGHALTGTGWEPTGAGRSATAQPDSLAQRQVWPAAIEFLRDVLSED